MRRLLLLCFLFLGVTAIAQNTDCEPVDTVPSEDDRVYLTADPMPTVAEWT